MPEAIRMLQRALERGREKEVVGGAGVIVVPSKGTALTAMPGATGLTNNKPGVVQQLPMYACYGDARDCGNGEEEDVYEFGEQGE